MKQRNTLSTWLTRRFQLIIRNEENFADKHTFILNNSKILVSALLIVGLITFTSIYIYKNVFVKYVIKEDQDVKNKRMLISLSTSLDSLTLEIAKKDRFIENFKMLVGMKESEEPKASDLATQKSQTAPSDLSYLSPYDSALRAEFEGSGSSYITSYSRQGRSSDDFENMLFFPPLNGGIVTSPYDVGINHYGIDIAANKNEPIKAVADGTVILSSWTNDSGYIIAIQHRSNIISLYKHNSVLLKKVGNFVRAGDIVSIIGNSGELSTGPHLHFELWYNGNPIDPAEFISF